MGVGARPALGPRLWRLYGALVSQHAHRVTRPKVLVAGATGYLGKQVIAALHAAGYPVRALARDEGRLGDVREMCAEVVVAEATKAETLTDVVGDAGVLFSSLGKHDFKAKPSVWDIDYRANMNLLDRAVAGGVQHVSFISVVGGPELRKLGIQAADARESVVDAIKSSGLTYNVLRPSGFFNDMQDFFNMAKGGTGWVLGDGTALMSPIHGADLAAFVVEKLGDIDARNMEFDVGGPDTLSYEEILNLAFAALGKRPKLRRVPGWIASALPKVVRPFNAQVADLTKAIVTMSTDGAAAPNYGTHRLEAFFAELAEELV